MTEHQNNPIDVLSRKQYSMQVTLGFVLLTVFYFQANYFDIFLIKHLIDILEAINRFDFISFTLSENIKFYVKCHFVFLFRIGYLYVTFDNVFWKIS